MSDTKQIEPWEIAYAEADGAMTADADAVARILNELREEIALLREQLDGNSKIVCHRHVGRDPHCAVCNP